MVIRDCRDVEVISLVVTCELSTFISLAPLEVRHIV